MIKSLFYGCCLLAAWPAAAAEWQAGAGSTVRFAAVQQGARFEGGFTRFTARIDFDPDQPAAGNIAATIDLGSVDTQYAERDEYLREADWFHIARWPQAEFRATTIAAAATGFVARGELTLRGVTRPVELAFTFTTTPAGARLAGSASLQRLDFGVGSGDWTDTTWVGNEVQVMVDLQLVPAAAL
jgi:polyisoprenoid-binding protein YceI